MSVKCQFVAVECLQRVSVVAVQFHEGSVQLPLDVVASVSSVSAQCWLSFLASVRIAFQCNVDKFRSMLPQRMQVQGVSTTVGSRNRSPPHTRGLSAHHTHVDAIAMWQSSSPSTRAHRTPALAEGDNTSSRTAALPQCATGRQDETCDRTAAEW